MKHPSDFDLDVMNALKEFPTNDSDSFLYIRGFLDEGSSKIKPGFLHSRGTDVSLVAMIYQLIKHSEGTKNAVFAATIGALKEEPDMVIDALIACIKSK